MGVKYDRTYTDNEDGRTLYHHATIYDPFPWVWEPDDEGSSGLGVAKGLKVIGAIDRYEWPFTFEAFIAANLQQATLAGTAWTNSMFDPDRNGIIRATGNLDDVDTGHEYLLRGVNWPRKWFRIRNNWTSEWGIKGEAYIPFDDMEKLLAAQGDCTVMRVG